MKFALFLVLSLSAMAMAGPAFNKNNQIKDQQQQQQYKQQQQQQQTYMTTGDEQQQQQQGAKSPAIDILKQWCFSSQMSQQELTASFKKLVTVVKSSPLEQTTEQAVMSERICQGALVQKSQRTGETFGQTGADAKAHELIKDVYMDALISCKSRECTEQLMKVISSQQVDAIRASYYMTRIAVTDKQSLKDEQEVKHFAEQFIQQQQQHGHQQKSEAVERQKLFAATSLVGKWLQAKPTDSQIKEVAQKVAQSIVERYVKTVSQQEVEQYKQTEQPSAELAKKIAKRSAALKALANIPGHVLKQQPEVEQTLVELCKNKQELSTVRQSAIECLEQNEKQIELLKEIAFEQEEPIEVRVAAYRTLMTVAYQADETSTSQQQKEQIAEEIVEKIVKHCEEERNQQQDDQFVLYCVSHLNNIRTSQQPEHKAIKEVIAKNKQHYMQIQVLSKQLKQQLQDVRRSSRNYKLEQEFNQIESGLVLEGDLIYESQQQQQQQQLPKLVRVNMSMPIMGETVNVIEITLRQNQMDEEILGALKLVQNTKFNSQSVSKVVDSFKSSVEKTQQQQQQQKYGKQPVEADLTIKVDGCTIVYLCVDDIKSSQQQHQQQQHQRNTRSVYSSSSIVDDVIEFIKRQPINFNRGFNVNINERLAKVLDVDANILAGLRFESRAQGSQERGDFEIVAQMEPRFSFEAIVGPAKVSDKKLLQRFSTKTALGLRLRFKKDELVDIHLDLPMNQMELFTVESQLVEQSRQVPYSYNYLPESIYGQEDIYASYPIYSSSEFGQKLIKRSIYSNKKESSFSKLFQGKQMSHSLETSESSARATGLRGKLRMAASPKDMSLFVSAIVQKYEPTMEGYRIKVEKVARQGDLKQYLVTVSTPGSRTDRTMSIRVTKQINGQRTVVKTEVQSPRMSFAHSIELIHDGRQYSLKTELVSRQQQWRHSFECGLLSSQSSRVGQFAYKPYVQVESTSLRRPIQLQGQIAYQQSPKSVISYELKCPTTGDFVQGKLIVEQRDVNKMSQSYRKRSSMPFRRSMQSPIELLMSMDLTLTNEIIAQVQEQAVKLNHLVDWNCQKYSLQADYTGSHKNLRKSSEESRTVASIKLNPVEQVFTVERKCPTDERKEYLTRVVSLVRPTGHQMEVECRYNGRRQSLVAYKHKVDVQKVSQNKYDCNMEMEIVDNEHRINEKLTGRARVQTERKNKAVACEIQSRQKLAKIVVDYESLAKHMIQAEYKCEQFQHKTEIRNNERQLVFQSRTDNKQTNDMLVKMLVELEKPTAECKFVVEVPTKRCSVAADLKLNSGKRSSLAIQTPRFASQGEFSFETISRPFFGKQSNRFFQNNLRFRSSLKDLVNKQAYWMDSAINAANLDKESSFIRFDSPYYRTDMEFDPREQQTKFATYARSKRSVGQYESPIYSTKDSSLVDTLLGASDKLNLGNNKLWMLRSIVSSPFGREQLKEQARRALFQYADRRQSHQHQFNWQPEEQRLSMDLLREPNTEFVSQSSFKPMRVKSELSANWERPSSVSFENEWMSIDGELKPFDQEESYAKLSAVSRHPRSAFKKHESEIRYIKDKGYKAHMKHQDKEEKQHSWEMESDVEPHKYAKMAWQSEKHGKGQWEHKWRKEQHKRSFDQEPVYKNKFALMSQGPEENDWKHETSFDWDEPISMISRRQQQQQRIRRSYNLDQSTNWNLLDSIYNRYAGINQRYSPIDYLKHTSARLVSQTSRNPTEQLYKLDFDYQPYQNVARLNVDMPENMLHQSEVELKPSEQLYKFQSKLYNRQTNEPSYELMASTKPYGLATAEQEPMFFHSEHPMFERPISKESLVYTLFKQPLKIDYSDKYGRKANLDYDQSPVGIVQGKYAGLRQKRAAFYVKDDQTDFEHSSSFDFYPETFVGKMKPSYKEQQLLSYNSNSNKQQMPRDVAFKTQTKYGPIVVRADTTDETVLVAVESPVMNGKLVAESGANMRQLIKIQLDNKSKRVELRQLLRELPATIRENRLVKKFVRKIDSGRFEHQSELLVSIVDQIFKIKSQSKFNEQPIVVIEGEWNQQQNKAYCKINGERINGQAVIDLVRKTADLVVDIDDKHTMHHVTRLVRTSDKFYSLESMTTYKSRPVFKLIGKVSAMIFEPSHLFASRRYLEQQGAPAHVSTFEAVIYEPKEYHITGQFDCDKKEARVVFKNVEDNKYQETLFRFDEQSETIFVDSRLSSQHEGQVYAVKAKLNLPGLYKVEECRQHRRQLSSSYSSQIVPTSCQSDVIYMDKSGNWSAKYVPGQYVAVSTPRGKQTVNLTGYNY